MNTFFEVKVKYQKIASDGKEKSVTETYLLDAVSFTEAESRTHKELEPYIAGDFTVTAMKIADFSEIIPNEDGDRWFKTKVTFITIDEEKGVEKKSNTYLLVQANNTVEAVASVNTAFADSVSDFEIPTVSESPIVDVFMYAEPEESEGVEPTGED